MKPKLISSNNGLVIKNLRKSLSEKTIVRDVSLHVQRGQTIGLLGPNGAGKTTTFYMIMGLIQPDSGEINLDDCNIVYSIQSNYFSNYVKLLDALKAFVQPL